jgi:hypothetical protein
MNLLLLLADYSVRCQVNGHQIRLWKLAARMLKAKAACGVPSRQTTGNNHFFSSKATGRTPKVGPVVLFSSLFDLLFFLKRLFDLPWAPRRRTGCHLNCRRLCSKPPKKFYTLTTLGTLLLPAPVVFEVERCWNLQDAFFFRKGNLQGATQEYRTR